MNTQTNKKDTTVNYRLGIPGVDEAVGGVESGTNLLISGPSIPEKSGFVNSVISQGVSSDDGTIYVTTKTSAEGVLNEYEGHDRERFGVVDCVSKKQGVGNIEETETVRFASSPEDMTGIGIEVSNLLDKFWEELEIERNRACLESVSTLLMYSDLETVFRFLHVFTGRIRSVDGLGIFVIDSEMHEEKDYSTLQQLFDGTVKFDREGRVRLVGSPESSTDWIEIGD